MWFYGRFCRFKTTKNILWLRLKTCDFLYENSTRIPWHLWVLTEAPSFNFNENPQRTIYHVYIYMRKNWIRILKSYLRVPLPLECFSTMNFYYLIQVSLSLSLCSVSKGCGIYFHFRLCPIRFTKRICHHSNRVEIFRHATRPIMLWTEDYYLTFFPMKNVSLQNLTVHMDGTSLVFVYFSRKKV